MLDKFRRTPILLPFPIFFSIIGIIFCVSRISGDFLNICVSTGCILFQDMTINGISMWYFGLGAFVLLLLLSFTGRIQLAKFFIAIIIFIDIILLFIMLFVAPCMSCLIVAFIFVCIYIAFKIIYTKNKKSAFKSILLIAWTILFIANTGFLLKSESSNWIIYGDEKANINMYFAPSCESCREGLIALANNSDVAFYPVNNDESDIYLVAMMYDYIKSGKNIKEALNAALLVKAEDYSINYFSYNTFLLYFRLFKNKAHVIEASDGVIPFFEFKGLPKALINKRDNKNSNLRARDYDINSNLDYNLPVELDFAKNCGGKEVEPCP